MMEQARQEAEAKQTEQSIIDRAPELKQLAETINKATEALNKAKTELDKALVAYRNTVNKTGEIANGIHTKIDSINTHIDGVVKTAPSKLTVSISATDEDMKTFKDAIDKEHQFLIDEFKKHNKATNDALIDARKDYMYRYKETEGIYFGHISQWFFLFFYSIGIFGTLAVVIVMVGNYFHWFR